MKNMNINCDINMKFLHHDKYKMVANASVTFFSQKQWLIHKSNLIVYVNFCHHL